MSAQGVLILGGGWGGLAVAHYLRQQVPAEYRIRVVEKRDTFSFCPSYLWLMTGERAGVADVERPMSSLADRLIEWVHEEVVGIDPEALSVTTSSGTFEADCIVLALGAEASSGDVPGFADSAYNLFEASGAVALRTALTRFETGQIAVLIARTPFRCPAVPYEAAFLIDAHMRDRGLRERVDIAVYTPEKQPMPVAGAAVGGVLRGMLEQRGIRYHPEHLVSRVDGSNRTIAFGEAAVPYDLLIGIPPHQAPRVVRDAGLTDSTGYIPVHPKTLEILSEPETLATRYPGLYAIGDVASVRLLNGLLLPKAGVFAEGEARVVAHNIAARLRGEPQASSYDGLGFCYVEVGQGMAAYGAGDFYAYPGPRVTLEPASLDYRRAKEEFEHLLTTWFTVGSPIPS